MMPKKELIRIVRTPDGAILIDLTGKKAGRGAYLCGKVGCFKLGVKSKALDRALKQPVGEGNARSTRAGFCLWKMRFSHKDRVDEG